MSSYVPFLKAKLGELNAMGALAPHVKAAITPFFDFPRRKPDYKPETFASAACDIAKGLKKHWGTEGGSVANWQPVNSCCIHDSSDCSASA